MTLPVIHVLAFGAWLAAQSQATPSALTISIFPKPPGVIPPGGSTTIWCRCQCATGTFVLYKDGHQLRTLELRGSRAEFSISNATQEDAGPYSCHYLGGEFRLPRPVLSVLPGNDVPAGAYVTFRCTIANASAGCFLYLEGQVKETVLLPKGDDFTIARVHRGKGGRYSCQCFTGATPMQWSAASQPLELVVRDYTWSNVARLALGAGVLLLLALMVAEAT
ncbi:PREDICTED: immunoglobulin superfamily member 1-like, partial [Apaloderma vittatum]|uniref:immunoglobulin superfamily member 1-like n=1 Tax=Apaloderma vittatum TaxID=57397 RepID=UPI0005214172